MCHGSLFSQIFRFSLPLMGANIMALMFHAADLIVLGQFAPREIRTAATAAVGATAYLSGNGARAYQVDEHFAARGIDLRYVDYHSFPYPQLFGEFVPNLSVLDYIFNCGYDWDAVLKGVGAH